MARTATKQSIIAVASESEVSIATVSRVLNNHPDVSEELRQRVLKVLATRGVFPRANRNRTTHLAVVLGFESMVIESFATETLSGISKYAIEQGVETSIVLHRPATDEKSLLKTLRERHCAGAILLNGSEIRDQLEELTSAGIATMLVASEIESPNVGYLATSSIEGAAELTQHLLNLGHRKIGFLCGPGVHNTDHQNRFAGYRDSMTSSGHQIDPRWIVPHQPTEMTEESGYLQTKALLNADPSVTAIIAATNDEMAAGAILACVESGRRVPEDISIVGFDDYPRSRFMNPPLTTYRQPLKEIGYEAAKAADTFARGILPALPRKVMRGEMIVRRSTAKAAISS